MARSPRISASSAGGVSGWRIAYSLDLGYYEVDGDVRRNTLAALDIFRSLGAEVVEVDLGWTKKSEKAADDYLRTIFGAWVAEYLDERAEKLTEYSRAFAQASQSVTAQDFLASLYTAGEMYSTFGPMMEEFDVFVCPTLALPAVKADYQPVDGLTINGIDLIHWNAAGQIDDFKVMVRPLKAVNAVHAAMAAMLQKLG